MMKQVLFVIVLLGCVLSGFAEDENNPAKRKKLAQREPEPTTEDVLKREGETLSTITAGLDSLDVLPDEMMTQTQGGTRRVKLETTVFKRHEPVNYAGSDFRDPFRALISDEKKEGEIVTDLLRLDGAVLTGVVWSDGKYLAMVKDKDGKSFFLREGEAVYSGRVLYVGQTEAVFEITEFGDYSRITLKVQG